MVGFRMPDGTVFLADCISSKETIDKYAITFLYDVKAYLETLDKVEQMEASMFVPSHAEALSLSLDRTKYAECEVSLDDALRYLHHETLTLAADVPRGYVLLTYRNIPIGFVKNIGNRANNLYPKEWAIRMDVRP
jgi:NOL1/NOP2/fmu family ribosome biogenesis protein